MMASATAKALATLTGATTAVGAVFVLGIRVKSPIVIDSVRRMTHLTNRFPMQTAGAGDAYASVVHHEGRRSGRSYSTPVRAVTTEDGFAIALPYGGRTDWVKNVLARCRATIDYRDATYAVDRPRVVPLSTLESHFSRRDQRAHRLFGVKECLVLELADGRSETAVHQ